MPHEIFEYVPHLFLTTMVLNIGFVAVSYVRARGSRNPERATRIALSGILMLAATVTIMPVVIGTLIGEVPSMFHLFRPREGNPWVIATHVTYLVFWLVAAVWVFLLGGADRLLLTGMDDSSDAAEDAAGRPALLNAVPQKLIIALMFAAGLAGLTACWFIDIPTSELPPGQ